MKKGKFLNKFLSEHFGDENNVSVACWKIKLSLSVSIVEVYEYEYMNITNYLIF